MPKQPNYQRRQDEGKRDNTGVAANSRTVDISKLKTFVAENFPPGSPLQIVFVGEDDVLSAETFLAKLTIWLKLSRLSTRH